MISISLGSIASIAALSIGGIVQPAVVDFEPQTSGATYGVPTHNPGDLAFSQNNIDVYLQPLQVQGSPQFFQAVVDGEYATNFATRALSLDNISTMFDFSGLGFTVTTASVEYQEFGGVNNFAVNGGAPVELLSLANVPMNIAPGIHALAADGLITLSADLGFEISSFLIGGQELGIDNVTAIPEPAAVFLLGAGGLVLVLRARRHPRS